MPTTEMMIEALTRHRAAHPGSAQMPPDYFWQLVERFKADLVNQAFAILGSLPDAEDAAQESLCEAFEGLSSLRDPRQLGHWMRQINRRNALDLLRKRRREAGKVDRARDLAADAGASGGFRRVEVREYVARAIDSLPHELREIVVLRYWSHFSYQEIARHLELPLGTVKSQLFRADALLEQRLLHYVENERSFENMRSSAHHHADSMQRETDR